MATLEEIKELLRGETGPINSKLDSLSTNFEELNRAVKFLSAKYDKLLPQVQQINEKLHQHTQSIHAAKDELGKVKKSATDAMSRIEELSQYVRRDCLEISGIKPTGECTCENIVTSIGKAIDVPITKEEISTAHQIPSYKADAPPKIIVKFTRRDTRNRFYGSRRKLANKKVKDLPDLNLTSTENVFISESLTPYKKKLFGEVNKPRKKLKWKYIWTQNGRIFIKANENTTTRSFDTVEDLSKFQRELEHLSG